MAGTGRPKAELVLSDVERDTLLRWSRRAKTSQALALRSKIVLACAEGLNNKDVAARLGIWPQTVSKWRGRGVPNKVEGLFDEAPPGAGGAVNAREGGAVNRQNPRGGATGGG